MHTLLYYSIHCFIRLSYSAPGGARADPALLQSRRRQQRVVPVEDRHLARRPARLRKRQKRVSHPRASEP